MRKPDAASAAARTVPSAGNRSEAPVELVCLALALAILVLAMRIVSIW